MKQRHKFYVSGKVNGILVQRVIWVDRKPKTKDEENKWAFDVLTVDLDAASFNSFNAIEQASLVIPK